jgi:8-oxo-dGTP pyrophosphatase MutT (NUDIX family)
MDTNLLEILDQIRAIAAEGLKYAKSEYDIARYERCLAIVEKEYSKISDMPTDVIRKLIRKELGCITPKLGIEILVQKKDSNSLESSSFLVLQRSDDLTWCFPCGFCDVSESPFDTAIRETKEETNLDVVPLKYIHVSNKGPSEYPTISFQVNMFIEAKLTSTDEVTLSHEHLAFKWISSLKEIEQLKWHPSHDKLAYLAFNKKTLV